MLSSHLSARNHRIVTYFHLFYKFDKMYIDSASTHCLHSIGAVTACSQSVDAAKYDFKRKMPIHRTEFVTVHLQQVDSVFFRIGVDWHFPLCCSGTFNTIAWLSMDYFRTAIKSFVWKECKNGKEWKKEWQLSLKFPLPSIAIVRCSNANTF